MKNFMTTVLLMATCITYAQKKPNGTIYMEHPAITTVEAMTQAFVSGNTDKVASYLADDFKYYSGTSTNKDDKGMDKAAYLKTVKTWKDNIDYPSIARSKGAYPDALEYKDADQKDLVWVQTWEDIKGVQKETGVKIDRPIHRLFTVNKDNKIKMMINYSTSTVNDEINQSFADRTNGQIYNHHENINSVRKMIYAFENKDFDKAYKYYDDKATFIDINNPDINKQYTLAEQKENDKKMFEMYDLVSIDQVGYPDYLHYELDDARVVQSWWKIRLIRKSDKKNIVLPMMFIDTFDDKGKITNEIAYYSQKILEVK
ncbi:nuclear transport factor 2 family protein [Flavobacterium aquariorum]|uniref:Nuclear transport factor 2 family protein n=1 Tax=Flavobacterium aquariorum TaxID=2217670 RepID=A0A2W7TS12_9FLAO|nr:nuclear transport factor 2 family protein [Flavobacterium aquariorum]PZX92106.1 nuclear transport factor 2 family protein [Flavobacterium aquariorum]